jgi:hypothetical protein
LTVPDPDAMFAQAVAAGARAVVAVQEAYGWRLGRVVDPFGHHWEIGHPLVSQPLALDELLRGVTDDNIPSEWDTGQSVGKEAL